jgi:hypothetical protein
MVCLSFLLSISTFSMNVLSDMVYTVGLDITILKLQHKKWQTTVKLLRNTSTLLFI